MTSIDFYFNAGDKIEVACRLAAKAFAQKKRVLVFAPDTHAARELDRKLWTWQQLSFVPHCLAHDPLAARTPVLIASDAERMTGFAPPEILLNIGQDCPPLFERFDRLLELVGSGDEDRAHGRARYKFYKERGYALGHHDLALSAEAPGGRH